MWHVKCCVLHGNGNAACHIAGIRPHEFAYKSCPICYISGISFKF